MTVYELRKALENVVNQNKKIAVWKDENSLESDNERNIKIHDSRDYVYIVSM